MKYLSIVLFLLFACSNIIGQHDIKMLNATEFNPDKYKDFKGSPYLWDKNKEVIIYDKNAKDYKSIMGNYNRLENEFEVYQNNKFIQLPHDTYLSIKVINDPGFEYTFFSNVHPKLKNKYCIQHKKSNNFRVVESFTAKKSLVRIETPGKATEINKIIPRTEYYLIYEDKLIPFKIKKKKLIKQFGHKKEIKSFLKEKKIKLKKIEDVLLLFEFLDSKGWLMPIN